MALPRWLAEINRKFVNPGAIKRGSWPVLVHVGRNSGRIYRTPLDATPVGAEEYAFIVNYGRKSDWPKNVMAAGKAELELGKETITLADPKLVPATEAFEMFPPDAKKPPAFVGVEQCLLMKRVS